MKIFRSFHFFVIVPFFIITLLSAQEEPSLERPFIWITTERQAALLEKIDSQEWAGSLFATLKERADAAVGRYKADRDAYLRGLPLEFFEGPDKAPRFFYIPEDWRGKTKGVMSLHLTECTPNRFLTEKPD